MLWRLSLAAALFAAGLGIVSGHAQFGPAAYVSATGGGGGTNNLAIDGTPVQAGGSTTTGFLITLTNTQANDVVYLIWELNGGSITTVTSAHATWTRRKSVDTAGTSPCGAGLNCLEMWTAVPAAALTAEDVSLSFSGTVTVQTSDNFSIKNQAGFDTNASLPGKSSGVAGNHPTISTTNANDMIIAACRQGTTSSPTADTGSGYTAIAGSGAGGFLITEWKNLTSTLSSATPTTGTGSGDTNGCITDAIKSN